MALRSGWAMIQAPTMVAALVESNASYSTGKGSSAGLARASAATNGSTRAASRPIPGRPPRMPSFPAPGTCSAASPARDAKLIRGEVRKAW